MASTLYPPMPWGQLQSEIGRTWQQGEHFGVVGPTGVGKTTFIARVLPARKYVVVLVTKTYDKTISKDFPDFERIEHWPPKGHQNRVLLWPKKGKTIRETQAIQREVFTDALNRIFHELNWCIVFDEQHYMCRKLKLDVENEMFLHQGRSSGFSIVNGAQRPAHVPLATYSACTHMAVWRNTLEEDRKRLSDIGGIDRRELEREMMTLDKHEFIYVHTRKGMAVRSQVER